MWMASILFTVLAAIVTLGPVNHLGLPRWAEILIGLGLVGLAQHYFLHRLFGASVIAPDAIPTPVLILFLWGEAFLMAAAFWTLLSWSLMLCHVPIPQWAPLFLGAMCATLMLWLGERQPPVQEHTVCLQELPEEAEGLRIAVIADLHIDQWRGKEWCETFVQRVNALHPDLILFTGDQQDGTLELRRDDLAPLGDLKAPYGKYLVSGNHEYYFEPEATLDYYKTLGITVIDHRTVATHGLSLIGIPDAKSLTQTVNTEQLEELVQEVPEGTLPILLVHKPGIAPVADQLGIKLQFSGHTHGGLIPGVYTLMKRFNHDFVRGWYDLPQGMQLFVAPGSGVWIGFPYRLYPSEISLITLHRAKKQE